MDFSGEHMKQHSTLNQFCNWMLLPLRNEWVVFCLIFMSCLSSYQIVDNFLDLMDSLSDIIGSTSAAGAFKEVSTRLIPSYLPSTSKHFERFRSFCQVIPIFQEFLSFHYLPWVSTWESNRVAEMSPAWLQLDWLGADSVSQKGTSSHISKHAD